MWWCRYQRVLYSEVQTELMRDTQYDTLKAFKKTFALPRYGIQGINEHVRQMP